MWDVFISHASEDKQFVRLLAKELKRQGLKVWFDEFTLQVGDSLRDKIDFGLANSKYGIVVLSKSFLAKKWPRRELNGLVSREDESGKIILPVWHDISMEEVRQFSPILADKLAVTSEQGLEAVTINLLKAIYLNQNSDWIPYEMQWPDNSTMVILPMAPIDNGAF